MNTYKVLKTSHKNGVKDGKKWDLITVILDVDDTFVEVNFWNLAIDVLPVVGDVISINYQLQKKSSYVFGKPVGFEIL